MNLYDFYRAKLAYTTEAIATDKQLATQIQEVLIWLGFLYPPADGEFNSISTNALIKFQEIMSKTIPKLSEEKGFLGEITAQALLETSLDEVPKLALNLGEDLGSRIIKYMLQNKYQLSTKSGEYNIVYIEGADTNGKLNDNKPNSFNDVRIIIEFQKGTPKIIGCWEATTEPGYKYNYNPINSQEAARIAFGQYKAWRVGTYGTSDPHEALIQVENVTVHRDFDKDFKRTVEKLETGLFGINQQWGYDLPRNNIALAGTGCLVGRTRRGHQEFIEIIKQDKRYLQNHDYLFVTTIVSGSELEKMFPTKVENKHAIKIVFNGFKLEQQHPKEEHFNKLIPQKLTEVLNSTPLRLLAIQESEISEEVLLKMPPEKQLELVKQYLQFLLNKLE